MILHFFRAKKYADIDLLKETVLIIYFVGQSFKTLFDCCISQYISNDCKGITEFTIIPFKKYSLPNTLNIYAESKDWNS